MKKLIFTFIAALTLTACGDDEKPNSYEYESLGNNPVVGKVITDTDTITETTTISESTTSSVNTITDLEDNYINNASKITSGVLYDNIKKVYPNINIYQGETSEGNILGIDLNIKESSISEECDTYIKKSKELIAIDEVSNYKSVVISMCIDSLKTNIVAMITFSPEDISTNLFTLDENYTDTLENLYNNNFSETDISIQFDNKLKKLEKEYHIK